MKIRIENEQLMVKCQIEGSNGDEILLFTYLQRADETKIKRFGLKIGEKYVFQNQQKSAPKFGRNEEQFDF